MLGVNCLHLIGTVTRNPEIKYTASKTAICEVGLAVNEKFKDKAGNWVEKCTFVDVTYFGRWAEVCGEFLAKGTPIYVQGRLVLDEWEDKQSGQKRSKLKVTGEFMRMLGSKGDVKKEEPPPPAPAARQPAGPPPDDEIPF